MSKIMKKILTVDDLIKFCQEQNFANFSSKQTGYQLAVKVPTTFEIEENIDDNHRGMMKLKFRIFHTGLNRNNSYVSKDAAIRAMNTIADRPVLAAIHQLDSGEWDFEGHEMEIITDENGNEELKYIESQVGSFSSEPAFWETENGKEYVCAYAYISKEYTKTCEIIERKQGTKNSCELFIDELAYNAKEKYLDLIDFYVNGSTLLGSRSDGTEIQEGMEGSRADIADFSVENNSVKFCSNEELLNEIKKLNENLSHFNIESLKEGGNTVTKFEELLNQYGKTLEDITFDYETLSDEELEAKFAEMFGEDNTDGEGTDTEPASEGDEENNGSGEDFEVTTDTENTDTDNAAGNNDTEEALADYSLKCSVAYGENMKEFSISMSEKLSAISTLVNETYENDGTWYYVDVFDEEKYVIMQDCWSGRAYKQSYKVKKDSYSLTGDRVEVYSIFVTEDERKKLDDMRANYSLISEKLAKYEAEPEKMEILNSESYVKIAETKEFVELKDNHFDLSLEEVSAKADEILLAYAKGGNLEFSTEQNTVTKITLPIQDKPNKKGRYGSLKFN